MENKVQTPRIPQYLITLGTWNAQNGRDLNSSLQCCSLRHSIFSMKRFNVSFPEIYHQESKFRHYWNTELQIWNKRKKKFPYDSNKDLSQRKKEKKEEKPSNLGFLVPPEVVSSCSFYVSLCKQTEIDLWEFSWSINSFGRRKPINMEVKVKTMSHSCFREEHRRRKSKH